MAQARTSDLIVGVDVSVSDVVHILTKSPKLTKKWKILGAILAVEPQELRNIEIRKDTDEGRFSLVINSWVKNVSSEATVEKLAFGIEGMKYQGMADKLRNECPKLIRRSNNDTGYGSETSPGSTPVRNSSPFVQNYVSASTSRTVTTKETNTGVKVGNSDIYYYPGPEKIIGQGGSSIVYRGYFKDPSFKQAAVKRVNPENFDLFKNELNIWKGINKSNHEAFNVVQLFDWYEQENILFFAMELATMNLSERLNNPCPPRRELIVRFLLGPSKGLKWLHKQKIIHRDIKPENILIFGGSDVGEEIAKLADFGISRKMRNNFASSTYSMAKGTEQWMAPEAILKLHSRNGQPFRTSRELDIFSLGMTSFFAISGGKHPFEESPQHDGDITSNIKDAIVLPGQLENNEFTANNLLHWMMNKDSDKRPSINQVLEHPFFWDLKKTLKFLADVARSCSDREDADWNTLWNSIDLAYQKYYQDQFEMAFNWELKVDSLLLERKSKGGKRYKKDSLRSLVELIRDKHEHHKDMKPELTTDDFFGNSSEGLSFDEEKYACYFLKKFPDIVIILFCALIRGLPNRSCLDTLDAAYFKTFVENGNGKKCHWADPAIQKFIGHLQLVLVV